MRADRQTYRHAHCNTSQCEVVIITTRSDSCGDDDITGEVRVVWRQMICCHQYCLRHRRRERQMLHGRKLQAERWNIYKWHLIWLKTGATRSWRLYCKLEHVSSYIEWSPIVWCVVINGVWLWMISSLLKHSVKTWLWSDNLFSTGLDLSRWLRAKFTDSQTFTLSTNT